MPALLDYADALNVRQQQGKRQVYDEIRRQYVALLPEEMVRQLWIQYLLRGLGYPAGKIRVEFALEINNLRKRCDLLVFDADFRPWLLIECKANQVPIDNSTFEQIAIYNIPLQVPYLVVSNGLVTHISRLDFAQNSFQFLEEMPSWGS